MRLLLMGDDATLWESLRSRLSAAGYAVDWVSDPLAAESALKASDYGAVLLQLTAADSSRAALQMLRAVRGFREVLPIMAIVGGGAQERAAALDSGADDCLAEPVHFVELCARLRALRRHGAGRIHPLLTHGPLSIICAKSWARD